MEPIINSIKLIIIQDLSLCMGREKIKETITKEKDSKD